ncbi:DNA circulation family protein [Rhizobium sp. PDO1-076]|uniref:DNA circularization N-terminal domain-containing protein n=1 Tax=Rhizobium sp. PDO1-076 TaxID=1125979 RepID=UPI00024E343F|nr:DNA circularization N-terminal domain-containing protein [Rhizobium sp. PDO1-076]EHS51488.1 DNA circulation family protein [Rhizobium sp. PDO1-076]
MILDSLDTLPGLLPGSYRGRTLHFLDTSTEVGRRVLEYLFPGVDAAAYDDFGVLPAYITIDALIIGDDYKAQVKSLQRAFETAGPGQLIHPWLGPMSVILEEPASIAFSSKELRVARINVRVKRVRAGSGLSSVVSGLTDSIAGLSSAAELLTALVGTKVLSSVRTAAVNRSARVVTSIVSNMTAPADSLKLLPQIRSALAATVPGTPAAFDAWIKTARDILNAVVVEPAVAPMSTAAPQPTAEARISVASTLAQGLNLAASSAPSDTDAALFIYASARMLAAAAQQSAYAQFESRRDAAGYRSMMTAALGTLVDRAEDLGAETYQSASSDLIRAARRVSAALVIDINEVIGRLPDVLTFSADNDQDAWQVAQHIAGDAPERIEDVYLDIVARNRPRHPAIIESGTIEALEIR